MSNDKRQEMMEELKNSQKATGSRMSGADTPPPQDTQSDKSNATDDDSAPSDDADDKPEPEPEPESESDVGDDADFGELLDTVIGEGVDGHLTAHNRKVSPLFVAMDKDTPAANDAQQELATWLADRLDSDRGNFDSRSKILDGLIRVGLHEADGDGVTLMSEVKRAHERKIRAEALDGL